MVNCESVFCFVFIFNGLCFVLSNISHFEFGIARKKDGDTHLWLSNYIFLRSILRIFDMCCALYLAVCVCICAFSESVSLASVCLVSPIIIKCTDCDEKCLCVCHFSFGFSGSAWRTAAHLLYILRRSISVGRLFGKREENIMCVVFMNQFTCIWSDEMCMRSGCHTISAVKTYATTCVFISYIKWKIDVSSCTCILGRSCDKKTNYLLIYLNKISLHLFIQ